MEKDTVLLSVKTYNELRDFKKNIESGKVYVISETWGNYLSNLGYRNKYHTENEVVEDFDNLNRILLKEIEELKNKLNKRDKEDNEKHDPKQIAIEDIRNMSWRQFKKWKNIKNNE